MPVQHTKGPWATDTDLAGYDITNRPLYQRIYAKDPGSDRDFTIGFVRDADPEVKAANGALLAAAPCLLAALEDAVRCGERDGIPGCPGSTPKWVAAARDAIRRAKGQTEEDELERPRR